MNTLDALLVLFVTELFAFAAVWHDQPTRSGMEHESERSDPAVLLSPRSRNLRKQALSVQVQMTVERPQNKHQLKGSTI